ncbi:MAG: AsmA family protein [Pseudomonadota bacterium]
MSKLIKWLLIAVSVVVVAVIALVAAVVLLFDPDDYRDELAAALTKATGRTVTVEGPLSLKLFPWLAIDTGSISVANAPAFGDEPMLSLTRASAAVKIAPLLSRRIEVGNVTVSGLTANLAVRGDGVTSWDDIVERLGADSQSAEDSGPEAATGLDISIAGIDLVDAQVRYADNGSGAVYTLSDVNLSADSVDLEAPIPLRGNLAFEAQAEAISGAVEFTTIATIGDDVSFAEVSLNGNVAGEPFAGEQSFTLGSELVAMNSAQNTLDVNAGQFTFGPLTGAFDLGGSGPADPLALRGRLKLEPFVVRELTDALKIDPIETADATVLQTVSIDGALAITFESAAFSDIVAVVDDTRIEGAFAITNFASGRMMFQLVGDEINLDRYLPPAEDAEIAADASDALAETALPVDLLRGLNAEGTLQFGRLTLGDLPFSSLKLGLKVADSKARLAPIKATVLNGAYEGDVRIDASGKQPTLSLNERVSGLDMGALASQLFERDNIEGTFAGQFQLGGVGETLADIRSSLNGDVSFALTDAVLTGTDVWYEIRRARALFKRETPPPAPAEPATRMTNLTGTAKVSNGVATNNDLYAELPFLQFTGDGTVNLADATVNYGLDARVLERPEFLTDASAEELDAYTEAVIPLKITGELAAPKIAPDIEGMARAAAKEKIDAEKDRLKRRLLDKLIDGDEAEAGEEGEEEEEGDIEDELKKRLKDLFGG